MPVENVDVRELPSIKCTCDNDSFKSVIKFHYLSAIRSGETKDRVIPREVVVCTACGQDVEELEDIKRVMPKQGSSIIQ